MVLLSFETVDKYVLIIVRYLVSTCFDIGHLLPFLYYALGKISLFFFIYYSCLAGFFALMFVIAFTTIPEREEGPKYTALLDDKPGTVL